MLTKKISITKRRLVAAIGVFILFISIWGALFYAGILQINHPTRQQFPIQGIDISEHQGEIDWAKIDRREVNFVFIKATEGGDYRDLQFDRNWLGAKNAKIDRGAYHFFTFCKAGSLQAQNFIDTVPASQAILPPVIDLEFSGNCQHRPSLVELKQELTDYITGITATYHQQPILYVTNEFYNAYLQSEFTDYSIWISDFYRWPNLNRAKRPWLFWQYSERGRMAGINTLVDLNVFYGTREQFQQLLQRSK